MIFLDSETCGLHGMPVLLQYAENAGAVQLWDIWRKPVGATLDLVQWIASEPVCGFNLTFDWFHLCKLYTIWSLLPRSDLPVIREVAAAEKYGRDGPCLKPESACDLMLHAKRGKYQSLMKRDPIRIRKIPTVLADALALELQQRVTFPGIYHAQWKVFPHKVAGFSDVVLTFDAKSGLKYLVKHALGREPRHFAEIEVPKKFQLRDKNLGYAPCGLEWPGLIQHHIDHWATNEAARDYATDDVVYTRELYDHFDRPEPGDDDSTLACAIAAIRWRGYLVDVAGIKGLLDQAQRRLATAPINVNRPKEVRAYIGACLDDMEMLTIEESTSKEQLRKILKWTIDYEEICTKCYGRPDGCLRCGNTGRLAPGPHPAIARVKEIQAIKRAVKDIDYCKKFVQAERFHASFKIVGTRSGRMSGGDGLNAQAIPRTKDFRSKFPLAWPGYVLSGGDFDAYEVTIAEAICKCPGLRTALTSGYKVHAYFGSQMFGKSMEEVVATEGMEPDLYTLGKQCFLGLIYDATKWTLQNKNDVDPDVAERAEEQFGPAFPGVMARREQVRDRFVTIQHNGPAIYWARDPDDSIETILGYPRSFELENRVAKQLFELARRPPKHWMESEQRVLRSPTKGMQKVGWAVTSAVYGAAKSLQQANARAAANHEIQSVGAEFTKHLQRRIWDLQPTGVHDMLVAPMNGHDELMCPCRPHMVDPVAAVVRETVEGFRPQIPLIGMTWFRRLESWAGKKGGKAEGEEKIAPNLELRA